MLRHARNCKQTRSRSSFNPPPPYDAFLRRGNLLPSRNERSEVKGGDTALPCRQSVANFKFDIFKMRVSVSQICKFERKTIKRSIARQAAKKEKF